MIPDFNGATFPPEWKEAPWDRFYMAAPSSLHSGLTRNTEAIGLAKQNSLESMKTLFAHYKINRKTVDKWCKRWYLYPPRVADFRSGRKNTSVKRYNYDDHPQLNQNLNDFIRTYNFGFGLKTPKGLTPYKFIRKIWATKPERFSLNSTHHLPASNT